MESRNFPNTGLRTSSVERGEGGAARHAALVDDAARSRRAAPIPPAPVLSNAAPGERARSSDALRTYFLRERVAFLVRAAASFVVASTINVGVTLLVQFIVERTFDRHAPFWPLFVLLCVLPFVLARRRG